MRLRLPKRPKRASQIIIHVYSFDFGFDYDDNSSFAVVLFLLFSTGFRREVFFRFFAKIKDDQTPKVDILKFEVDKLKIGWINPE